MSPIGDRTRQVLGIDNAHPNLIAHAPINLPTPLLSRFVAILYRFFKILFQNKNGIKWKIKKKKKDLWMHASMRETSQHHNSICGEWGVQVKWPSTTEKKWPIFSEHPCQNTSSKTREILNPSLTISTFYNQCWFDPKSVGDQMFKLHWSTNQIWNDGGIVSTIQIVIPLVNPFDPRNMFLKEIPPKSMKWH